MALLSDCKRGLVRYIVPITSSLLKVIKIYLKLQKRYRTCTAAVAYAQIIAFRSTCFGRSLYIDLLFWSTDQETDMEVIIAFLHSLYPSSSPHLIFACRELTHDENGTIQSKTWPLSTCKLSFGEGLVGYPLIACLYSRVIVSCLVGWFVVLSSMAQERIPARGGHQS